MYHLVTGLSIRVISIVTKQEVWNLVNFFILLLNMFDIKGVLILCLILLC